MKEINFDTLLFRASSMGDLMTEPRSKSEKLSKTCMNKCIETVRTFRTGRQRQINSKYLIHGTAVEEDSITQYSVLKKVMLYKHSQRVNDSHFTGEIDTSDVDKNTDIRESKLIVDAKSCWEVHTMPSFMDKVESNYFCQMQTYMGLIPNAEKAIVAKVLTNHSVDSILKRIDSLRYKHGIIENPNDEFLKEVKELEKNSIYDRKLFERQNPHYDWYTSKEEWIEKSLDIPLEYRVHEFVIERDDNVIQSMRDRVDECREWLRENYKNL